MNLMLQNQDILQKILMLLFQEEIVNHIQNHGMIQIAMYIHSKIMVQVLLLDIFYLNMIQNPNYFLVINQLLKMNILKHFLQMILVMMKRFMIGLKIIQNMLLLIFIIKQSGIRKFFLIILVILILIVLLLTIGISQIIICTT